MKSNKGAKVRPIQLTIIGDDARKLREWARDIGVRAATIAHILIGAELERNDIQEKDDLDTTEVIAEELKVHAKDTGIPTRELRELCFRAGLESLRRGELKVTAIVSKALAEEEAA